ncbi:HEAT repeat domain-containing protein [Desulfobacter latus]|uniref:HEAT repeat domain-containing protein n=1 Tax=Desulfobacter latus TaxID=2292 RepID=A0A850T0E1_9BACT|nr:HEAT repeat domain-containing protein [Desulfobacter latus]NWH05163.1 HEAT repeat domain-containing protein [Desulfobacter latus]
MERLKQKLHSPDEAERLYAVQDILDEQPDKAPEWLVERLGEESSVAVRESLVDALKGIDIESVFPRLFGMFSSPEAFLRNAAVDIFGEGGDAAIAFLTAYLDHADREVRKLVMDSLYATRSKTAVMALRAGLFDPSVNVKITAVEYLGQLSDTDSLPEMIRVLETKTEPMLVSAILEALSVMGGAQHIQSVFKVLCPNGDIREINGLFLPEFIRLVARSGDVEIIEQFLSSMDGSGIYAEDYMEAVIESSRRFPRITGNKAVRDFLLGLIENTEADPAIRYTACDLVLENQLIDPEQIDPIGFELMEQPGMQAIGLRWLFKSDTQDARQKIQDILKRTGNQELKQLYEDLTEQEY